MVRKASSLKDIVNVFHPKALTEEEEQDKFYQPTAAVRDGKNREFHDDLFESIKISEESANNSHLLVVGHGGCGKSTELRMLARKLRYAGTPSIIIEARDDMNLNDFSFIDISVLIVGRLAKYAEDERINVDKDIISAFQMALSTETTREYWDRSVKNDSGAGVSAGIGISGLIKATARYSKDLKMGSGLMKEFRIEVEPKKSEITRAVNALINDISCKIFENRNNGNPERGKFSNIVIIIDGLEKCRQDCVKTLFAEDVSSLSAIDAHMVVACPINVYRSPDASVLKNYFPTPGVMPMIKTHNRDDSPNPEGINVITQLILKRVDASFFEDGVLDKIIKSAGGSLRDTCYLLRQSAFEAYMRKREKVDEASLDFVSKQFAAELFLAVRNKYYQKISDINNGDKEARGDEASTELLYGGAVFEYNGERWIDLHPLIRSYVKVHPEALKWTS